MAAKRVRSQDFNEAAYLAANADVEAAVKAGTFKSGWQHFERHGCAEGRDPCGRLSRQGKFLHELDIARMQGLEIGPLMTPLVSKADGPIIYVDHADTETLRKKYDGDPGVETACIVPVDRVWGVQSLQECLGQGCKVDYVINSHVIEHVPDVVTWLAEIGEVLKPGGCLRMAIPDRRYMFDILRAESTLADALDAYVRRARVPLPRAILDHFLHYTEVDAAEVWAGRIDAASLKPKHPPDFALRAAETSYRSGNYQDTHCWVFTPLSFAKLCLELVKLDQLGFDCERIYPTERHAIEFIAALRPSTDRREQIESWSAAIQELQSEPPAAGSSA